MFLLRLGEDRVRIRREGLQQPQRGHARRREATPRLKHCMALFIIITFCMLLLRLGADRVRIRGEVLQQPQRGHARRREAAARVRAREGENRREVCGGCDGAEGPRGRRNHLACGVHKFMSLEYE